MKTKKLKLIATVLACAMALTGCGNSQGSSETGGEYPKRNIEMIVAFGAGGAVDTAARLVAPALERELGATVEVKNVPGAGGQTGYTELSRAKPDGYTIGTTGSPSVVVAPLDPSRGAVFNKDSFQPLAMQVTDPMAIAVKPDSKYNTLDDLLKDATANPGKINATSTGLGGGEHFFIKQLGHEFSAELNPVHLSEGQAAATSAFLGGHVEVYVGNVSDVTEMEKDGQARTLGVASEKRAETLPDVQTFAEAGYPINAGTVRGYSAPAGLPDEVLEKLDKAFDAAINNPEVVKSMENLGLHTDYQNSEGYAKVWQEQHDLYSSVIDLVIQK